MSKIAIVTGGSRGIGNAIALDLLDKGYRVGVGYYKNKSLAEEITKENTHALPLYIDITSLESIEKAFNEIENSYGSIDILINNAGISQVKSFESLEEEDWQIMWETNFMSAVRCIKLALPSMIKKESQHLLKP